jgi:hypothetical protein
VGGTSAACPVFAGAIALLNDALIAAGNATMGFLNPWIYGTAGPAGVFFDVTTGKFSLPSCSFLGILISSPRQKLFSVFHERLPQTLQSDCQSVAQVSST